MKLHNIDVKVVSVICDGPSAHFTMAEALGAKVTPPNISPIFNHPADSSIKIAFMFDACHIIKLTRNVLASVDYIEDGNGQQIRWSYVENLHKLQSKEGLHLAIKLNGNHIKWDKQKMKVKLATQTLSRSVADAIEFCDKRLSLPEFKGCDATVYAYLIVSLIF